MRILHFILIFLLILPAAFAADLTYVIKLGLDEKGMSVEDIKLSQGETLVELAEYEYPFTATLYSFKEEKLQNINFTITGVLYTEDIEETVLPSTIMIVLDYFSNGHNIIVLNPDGDELLNIDVSQFSGCNEDEFCDFNEYIGTCPSDCTEQDVQELEEAITGEEIPVEETEEQEEFPLVEQYGSYILILAIAGIIAVVIIIKARKRE
ncbi:MAG: hypothetical protein ABIB71_01340 [Candidatus Woesearchaeota archaeon]